MARGMDFDELYPGRFMKAGEFHGKDVTLQIATVKAEELEDEEKKKIRKALVTFEPTAPGRAPPKGLVLCKTNGLCLREMFGRNSGDWIGKRVTFCPELVDAFGAKELAIRVRGSPDIAADITFNLRLPQKKARRVTLKKTAARGAASAQTSAPAPTSPAAPEPPPSPLEPPADVVLPGQAGYSGSEPPPPSDADAPGGVR